MASYLSDFVFCFCGLWDWQNGCFKEWRDLQESTEIYQRNFTEIETKQNKNQMNPGAENYNEWRIQWKASIAEWDLTEERISELKDKLVENTQRSRKCSKK
jgi:hypothetical protein